MPSTFTVTNTLDCGTGSLRQAILDANGTPNVGGPDTIGFNITAASDTAGGGTGYNATTGVATITPLSVFPTITDPVVIDGYTQTGATPNSGGPGLADNAVLRIDLNGNQQNFNGLTISADNSTVKGLVINSFTNGAAITVQGGGGNHIEGNFIGTDVTGMQKVGNYYGVFFISSGDHNTVGGTSPGMGNLISGNVVGVNINQSGDLVEGNFIGTDKTGSIARGNDIGVYTTANSGDTIGGIVQGARNIISGNRTGIRLGGSADIVEGNYIGTDVSGMADLANSEGGVSIQGTNNTIGGTQAGASNVISGGEAVFITGSSNLVQGNYIGTNATGTASLNNTDHGVDIYSSGNTIGGTAAGAGNLISGTNTAIYINSGSGNVAQGNLIGANATNTGPIGNHFSGVIDYGSGNTIGGTGAGAGNVIANSDQSGVHLIGSGNDAILSNIISANGGGGVVIASSSIGDSILSNSIYGNIGLGIDLGGDGVTRNGSQTLPGPNNWQWFPVLSSASTSSSGTTISGTFHSTANTSFTLQFFSNTAPDPSGYGEGQTVLGCASVTTDASGNATFTANLPTPVPTGQCSITATATNISTSDTSEFSQDIPKLTTVTTVMSSVNPSLLNQAVTFTAMVSGGGNSTGTVQFQVDGINLAAPVNLIADTATISTSSLPVGPHTIAAIYSGDGCSYGSIGSLAQNIQYSFSGFLPPLNSNLALALNRTVPIKFQLTDYNKNNIGSMSAVTSLQVVNSQGQNVLANAGGTALRSGSGQFVANWQTKGLAAGVYTVTLTLADGTTYKKTVQLAANGGNAGLVVDGSATTTAVGSLLAGNIELFVDNSNGDLTADELARIQDAVNAVDAVTAPYGAVIEEVTDPTQANVTLNMGTTSAVGGYADGVLGCTTDAGQVTFITGWNFYAGSDPTKISSGQYDFESVVTHELGHALGLGHSTDSTSVMYATLNTSMVKHALIRADLNVPDSDPAGACGLHATPSLPVVSNSSSLAASALGNVSDPARASFGGQTLPPAMNFDPHLVAALVDSSLRSPYTMALLAAPSIVASDRQFPVLLGSKETSPRLAWEQRPLNAGGLDLVFANYNGRDDMDDASAGNATEPVNDSDLVD